MKLGHNEVKNSTLTTRATQTTKNDECDAGWLDEDIVTNYRQSSSSLNFVKIETDPKIKHYQKKELTLSITQQI